MASFDIESPFTNIPLQETIDLCVENLFQDRTHVDNLSKDSFGSLEKITYMRPSFSWKKVNATENSFS